MDLLNSNFVYIIAGLDGGFDSLSEARKLLRYLIKEDTRTSYLSRDEKGRFYIVRHSLKNNKIRYFNL